MNDKKRNKSLSTVGESAANINHWVSMYLGELLVLKYLQQWLWCGRHGVVGPAGVVDVHHPARVRAPLQQQAAQREPRQLVLPQQTHTQEPAAECQTMGLHSHTNRATQSHYGATQSHYGATRSHYGATQSHYGATRSHYGATRSHYGATRSHYGATRSHQQPHYKVTNMSSCILSFALQVCFHSF